MAVIEFFENNPSVFGALFLAISAYVGFSFVVGGRRAESRFPPIDEQNVVFREKGVSGRSTTSPANRFGGASRALDVVVTDTELWIKGVFPAFSFVGSRFDLLHKVPLSSVRQAEARGNMVELKFMNEQGKESRLELELKDRSDFLGAVNG